MNSGTRRLSSPVIVALAGLALVATLALAAPAISGTTLPKLSKQVKKLKKKVKTISKEQGPEGPQGPAGPRGVRGPTGPPGPATGAAGGDLTGTYPNPQIEPGAVTLDKLGRLPALSLYAETNQSVFGASSFRDVTWDVTGVGREFSHSAGADFATAQVAGLYRVSVLLTVQDTTSPAVSTTFTTRVTVNGTEVDGSARPVQIGALSSQVVPLQTDVLVFLDAGDALRAQFASSSANGRMVLSGLGATPVSGSMTAVWAGPPPS